MSHRTVREPTDEERDQLKQMKRQEVGRVAMRAHMILLSDRGHSPSEIADLHAVSHPTVYKWIDRFDEEGPRGLYDREREGRPLKIDLSRSTRRRGKRSSGFWRGIRLRKARTPRAGGLHASQSTLSGNSVLTFTKTRFAEC